MVIEYTNKTQSPIMMPEVKGTSINYTIAKEDVERYKNYLLTINPLEVNCLRVFLKKDNQYDMLIDSLDDKLIIIGQSPITQEYLIIQYIINEGKEKFLNELFKKI